MYCLEGAGLISRGHAVCLIVCFSIFALNTARSEIVFASINTDRRFDPRHDVAQAKDTSSSSGTANRTVETRFIDAVKALKVNVVEEKEAEDGVLNSIKNSQWKIEFFSLTRYEMARGVKTIISIRVDTGCSCVRHVKWIKLIGKPSAINLAEPLSFIDISTPEDVDRYLGGRVVTLHYRLDEHSRYSIYSDDPSGCFGYLRID